MGYAVGKLVVESRVVDSEWYKTIAIRRVGDFIWFKSSRSIVAKVPVSDVIGILGYKETEKCVSGVFYYKLTLKEMHNEVVYSSWYKSGSGEFYIVSAIQYLFCLSKTDIMRVGSNYVTLRRRSCVKKGRKKGYKVIRDSNASADALERYEHNANVAVGRKSYAMFVEAVREFKRETGGRFDSAECLKMWNKLVDK